MKIFLSLLIAIISFGFLIGEADAKRFGGGKSFGMNRSASNQSATRNAAAPQTKPASTASKWLGPLAGLAAGGLLASLFMGHGLGSGILSWLMIGAIAFLAWRLISRLRAPRNTMQQAAFQAEPNRVINDAPYTTTLHDTSAPLHTLSSFEEAAFLRQAKTTFIRLQAAYDNKNLLDIREFTAPEVFAEIQMQIQERGEEPNQTEVISIDAKLVDFDSRAQATTASVRFSGLIREKLDQSPEVINEIWHFTKDTISQNWLVAGIQQD